MKAPLENQPAKAGQSPLDTTQVLPRRHPALGPALMVLLGAVVRFTGLADESIWLDEATSIIIARLNLPSVVAWAAGDIHPPLYYLVLHFWLRFGESEFAVRALSAVVGVLTVAATYALARELFGSRVGMYAALLLALSPMHIPYSQEVRMYAMVAVLSLLASYFLLLALRRQRWPYWLGYVVCATLSLYTHYFALFALLFQVSFLIGRVWKVRVQRRQLWFILLALCTIFVLFLPWLPILYRQSTTGGGGWVEKSVGQPSWRELADTWVQFSIGPDRQLYPVWLRRLAYGVFALCLLSGLRALAPATTRAELVEGRNSQRESLLFCVTYILVPVMTVWLLSQFKPMYTVRYLLPFLPAYYILVAQGIHQLPWSGVRILALVLLALTALLGDYAAWRTPRNADWRSASALVLRQAQAGDVVLFSPRWDEKPFEYYARQRIPVNIDLPIPVTETAAQQVTADLSQRYQRVWLFWERGHYSDSSGMAKLALDERATLVETRDFQGIHSLFLYELSTSGGR